MTSSKRGLILITANFPFDRGEEFIEPESAHLSSHFDSVLVVPLSYSRSSKQTRVIPDNFKLVLPDDKFLNASWRDTLLRFTTRHPLQALGIAATSLQRLPNLSQVAAEFRFSLSSALFFSVFRQNLEAALDADTRYTIYSYWFHTEARVGQYVHSAFGYPFVSRGHRGDIYDHQSPINYLPGRSAILRSLDHLFAVSDQGRDHLRNRYPRFAKRISTARLGVTPSSNAGNAELQSRTIVSCSRVVPVKRLTLLVDALAEFQSRGHEVRWVHLGGGAPELTRELAEYAAERLTSDTYTLLGDLTNSELRAWYASNPASVFINVSASEGVPVSIMEALAQGLPVIATDVGGTSELIAPETNMFTGLLPADPTPQEIADRIERLFSLSQTEYRKAVQGSLQHWRASWSAEANFEAFASMLARRAIQSG